MALLCAVIGRKKLAPLSQPIRTKTKTNHSLLSRVFPRFEPVTCIRVCCDSSKHLVENCSSDKVRFFKNTNNC